MDRGQTGDEQGMNRGWTGDGHRTNEQGMDGTDGEGMDRQGMYKRWTGDGHRADRQGTDRGRDRGYTGDDGQETAR